MNEAQNVCHWNYALGAAMGRVPDGPALEEALETMKLMIDIPN